MENSFKTFTDQGKSILILLPQNPDFDEVASATSLYQVLKTDGTKDVNIFCPTPMIVEFNNLVGVNKIKNELGNKNLSLTFENYNPQGIEKVSWDIDDGRFKLTVVPKPNVTPPNEDQVIISYSGVAADLIIMVGGKSEESFTEVKTEDLKDAKLAHISIRELNIPGKTIASFAQSSSSISEVAYLIIKSSGYKIDEDVATNILMGIDNATEHFSKSDLTADTFANIAELMRAGGKRARLVNSQAFTPMQSMPKVPSSWTEPKIFKGTSVS